MASFFDVDANGGRVGSKEKSGVGVVDGTTTGATGGVRGCFAGAGAASSEGVYDDFGEKTKGLSGKRVVGAYLKSYL